VFLQMLKAWAVSLLLVTSVWAGEPTDAVMRVLDQRRDPGVSFDETDGLIVSPYLGPKRRELLSERWRLLGKWLDDENAELVSGEEIVDGDLGAVLLGAKGQSGPGAFRILLFGTRLVDGEWKVGPSEGSFANVGAGFDSQVRKRVSRLEKWMRERRVISGGKLLSRQRDEFFKHMKRVVSAKDRRELPPRQVLERFIDAVRDAVREKRSDEILVWLGVLEQNSYPGVDWTSLVRMVRRGVEGEDAARRWRLLNDTSIVHVIADEEVDEESASSLMIFLAPYAMGRLQERFESVRFHFDNNGSGWRIRLPAFFHESGWQEERMDRGRDYEDMEMRSYFGRFFEKTRTPVFAESPEELVEGIVEMAKKGDMEALLRRIYRRDLKGILEAAQKELPAEKRGGIGDKDNREARRLKRELFKKFEEGKAFEELDREELQRIVRNLNLDEEFDEEREAIALKMEELEDRRQDRYMRASEVYGRLSTAGRKGEVRIVKVLKEDDLALAIVEASPTAGNWNVTHEAIWMYRDGDAWTFLSRGVESRGDELPDRLSDLVDEFDDRFVEESEELKKSYFKRLVEKVTLFDREAAAVPTDRANELVQLWREAVRGGRTLDALELGGLLRAPRKAKFLLQDIAQIIRGAEKSVLEDQLLGVETKGRLCFISG